MSSKVADIFGIGTPEMIIILVIVVLLFGAKKLPDLAKSVGTSIQELKKGVNGDSNGGSKPSDTNQQ